MTTKTSPQRGICYCPSDCTCRNAQRLTICGCTRHEVRLAVLAFCAVCDTVHGDHDDDHIRRIYAEEAR